MPQGDPSRGPPPVRHDQPSRSTIGAEPAPNTTAQPKRKSRKGLHSSNEQSDRQDPPLAAPREEAEDLADATTRDALRVRRRRLRPAIGSRYGVTRQARTGSGAWSAGGADISGWSERAASLCVSVPQPKYSPLMAMEYVVQRLEMGDVVLSTFLSARRSLLCAALEQPADDDR